MWKCTLSVPDHCILTNVSRTPFDITCTLKNTQHAISLKYINIKTCFALDITVYNSRNMSIIIYLLSNSYLCFLVTVGTSCSFLQTAEKIKIR